MPSPGMHGGSPDNTSMRLARQFLGHRPMQSGEAQTMPQGVTVENMHDFGRTPAGMNMIDAMMRQVDPKKRRPSSAGPPRR